MLIAPNAITFPELVPQGYAYLFDNEEEQYNKLKMLLDDTGLIEAHRDKIRQHTMHNFSQDTIRDRYHELFTQHAQRETGKLKEISEEAFKYVKKVNSGFTDLKTIQQQLGKYNLGWQAFPLLKIKRILNNMGYKDEFKGLWQGVIL